MITRLSNTAILISLILGTGCATQTIEQTSFNAPVADEPSLVAKTTAGPVATEKEPKSIIMLREQEPGSTDRLATVYFNYDSSQLSDSALNIIFTHIQYLRDHPSITLVIEGHADDRGSDKYNARLGEKRAQAIKNIMLSQDISEDKIRLISYGESKPAINGHSEIARSLNRRATLIYQDSNNLATTSNRTVNMASYAD